jgi:uncharacterized cupredoxin-like copper-binding protein
MKMGRGTFATRARRVAVVGVAMVGGGVLWAGCSSDSNKSVDVNPQEYSIKPSDGNAKPGGVEFAVNNVGGTTHEFVVVRASDAASLPTKADGSVDEDKIDEADKLGEIEDIEVKGNESKTFDLEAGDYVLFCNIVDDSVDPPVSHFAEGMHAQFTVSD